MAAAWWLDGHNERATWAGKAVARLEELVPHGGHDRKATWTTYLSHAIYVAGLSNTVEEISRASLFDRVGRCQASLGQYSAAETTHGQALSLRRKRLGREHPSTLTSMSNLALVLESQGKYEEAEAMNRQTLALKETVLSVYCLAYLLASRHCYDESFVLYERACAAYPAVLGEDHPTTRVCRQHYSKALASQKQYTPDNNASTQKSKSSKLSRGLAKICDG
jgi:tetratricopeptide (TPR) repeat protein